MEFVWTPDQREFRAGVRRQLQSRAPVSRARELLTERYDADLWRELAQQSGLQGIAVPEEYAGSGGTRVELALVAEELGRVLLGGPFLSTVVLATEALLASGDEAACAELLPPLVEGDRTAALAVVEASGRWSTDDVRTQADADGRLTGRKAAVLDGADADLLVVAAQGPGGCSLYAVEGAARGLTRTPRETLDQTRRVADVELSSTPGRLLGSAGTAAAAVERVVEAASVFLAAEQVGGSAACVELTADYARTRRQFGRTIGSFQGVKHRLADMAVRLELARSAAYWAAWQEPGSADAQLGASVARSYCSDAFLQTAKDTIQLHGGIGFTWEHDAHLYLRRARADAGLVGDAAEHRRRLLPLLAAPDVPPPVLARPPGGPRMTVVDDLATDPASVAGWLDAHLPPAWVQAVRDEDWDTVEELRADPAVSGPVLSALAAVGLATPEWPREHGGLGLAPDAATAVAEQVQHYRAHWPMTDFISLALAGPTILAHGTPEQKDRFLAPTARGEIRWCQLFSEPGAGSDLAGLSTRAERQDDGTWLVNGQKVWSSFAHLADFGILMARTDPSLPKHRGITYFLLDMRTPGVETRPLRQMTGDAEFNEVFLTDVVVPDEVRLGAVNDGWAVGISTLMQERSGLSGRPAVGPGRADQLLARADTAALQDRVLELLVRERVLQMTTLRSFAEAGTANPAEGSIRKLAHAVLLEDLACLAMDVEPFGGASWPAGEHVPQATEDFLSMKELSIAGGTSEIQRNIIAERLLGLPKDVDPEKGLPFEKRLRS